MTAESIETVSFKVRSSTIRISYLLDENGIVSSLRGDVLNCIINGKAYHCGDHRTFTKESLDYAFSLLSKPRIKNDE